MLVLVFNDKNFLFVKMNDEQILVIGHKQIF